MRRHKRSLLIGTLVFFFMSLLVGVGSLVVNTQDLAAKVGRHRIKAKTFYAFVKQMTVLWRQRNPSGEMTSGEEQNLKNEVLRELIVRELLNMEARRWGMRVSRQEVLQDVVRNPSFHREERFDPRVYYEYVIRNLGILPKEFEKERQEDLLSMKFRSLVMGSLASTEPELKWQWQLENPAKTDKEWAKDKATFGERVYVEKMIGLLNQLLFKLSQKHRVQIYLNQ